MSTMDFTLEEMGRGFNSCLEVEIEFDYQPAEPMVRYYADGSGYPGCPASIEIVGVTVKEYGNDVVTVKRSERPDWFAWLDQVAENHIRKDESRYTERWAERWAER